MSGEDIPIKPGDDLLAGLSLEVVQPQLSDIIAE
jgi:hypothetical protein